MFKFVDRQKEMATLEKEYKRKDASFVVVYGRRRTGKTTLIHEFCKDKISLSFLATEENERQNMQAFQNKVYELTHNELLQSISVTNWEILFQEVANNAKEERVVLFIDEFQYLGKANTAFPSVFMKIWDEILSQSNIMLIVCGSLIHMMVSQVLNYNSPLYGRRTAQIKMQQIPYSYYHEFMPNIPTSQLIEKYAVTGGVPKYINLFQTNNDIYEEIKINILETTSFLYEEPLYLLQNEVNEINHYFTIIKVIAFGHHKLSDISKTTGLKQTTLTKYLLTLQELDIVTRQVPVTEEIPEKSKKGLYFLKDNYFKFWFTFVYPYRDLIETGRTDYVLNKIQKGFIASHVGYVYEDICREHVWSLLDDSSLNIDFNRVGRWWGHKDVEIDIVAYDSLGNDILFGECKYSKNPKDVNVFYDLKEKVSYVSWNNKSRQERFVIYSKSGFTDKLVQLSKNRNDLILISFNG